MPTLHLFRLLVMLKVAKYLFFRDSSLMTKMIRILLKIIFGKAVIAGFWQSKKMGRFTVAPWTTKNPKLELNPQVSPPDLVVFGEGPGLAFQVDPAFRQDVGVVAHGQRHGDILLYQEHGEAGLLQTREGLE